MSAVERLAQALGIDPALVEDAVNEVCLERDLDEQRRNDPYWS